MLGHQLIGYGVGHGNYIDVGGSDGWGLDHPGKVQCVDTWKYLSVFIDKAIHLRVPEGYPTTEPFTLKQVDPSQGLLIKPHAIEDMFQKERLPLLKQGDEYLRMDDVKPPIANGYVSLSADPKFIPGEGVPLVELTPRMGPQDWLLVKRMQFAMDKDPMTENEWLRELRPSLGDSITVNGKEFFMGSNSGK